jgi:hypothetical protein
VESRKQNREICLNSAEMCSVSSSFPGSMLSFSSSSFSSRSSRIVPPRTFVYKVLHCRALSYARMRIDCLSIFAGLLIHHRSSRINRSNRDQISRFSRICALRQRQTQNVIARTAALHVCAYESRYYYYVVIIIITLCSSYSITR